MKFKVGDVVYDRWWPWNIGRVIKILKTRTEIEFSCGRTMYDSAHTQFLEKVNKTYDPQRGNHQK